LLWILKEIRAKSRADLSPADLKQLEKEDRDEEKELRGFKLQGIVTDDLISPPSTSGLAKNEERRHHQSG
jgi:peptide-N4-(N-acetyl-beta-glucosaminyl)asparagine amidase